MFPISYFPPSYFPTSFFPESNPTPAPVTGAGDIITLGLETDKLISQGYGLSDVIPGLGDIITMGLETNKLISQGYGAGGGRGKGVGGLIAGKRHYAHLIRYLIQQESYRSVLSEATKFESFKHRVKLKHERNLVQEAKIIKERQNRIIASTAIILSEI